MLNIAIVILIIIILIWILDVPVTTAIISGVAILTILNVFPNLSKLVSGRGEVFSTLHHSKMQIMANKSELTKKYGEWLTKQEVALLEKDKYTKFAKVPMWVDELSASLPYRSNPYQLRTQLHAGQRKLNLNEIYFIAKYIEPNIEIVYAGAAPGIHIPYLYHMFKKFNPIFHLWDPRPYQLPPNHKEFNIFPNTGYFTDDVARLYVGKKTLFISDIRTGAPATMTPDEVEERVKIDTDAQDRWVRIMQPKAAMLKFRQPYKSDGESMRMEGRIMLQPWAPRASSEARIFAEPPFNAVPYTPREYEDALYYFNFIRRWFWFQHDVPLQMVHGLCHCYDCAFEIEIWKFYLQTMGIHYTSRKVADLMNGLSKLLHRGIYEPPHGILGNAFMVDKSEEFIAKFAKYQHEQIQKKIDKYL